MSQMFTLDVSLINYLIYLIYNNNICAYIIVTDIQVDEGARHIASVMRY